MKTLLVVLFCLLTAICTQAETETPPAPVTLDSAFAAESVWATPAAQFVEANKALGFHWVSATHDTAQSVVKGGMLFGQPVCQSVVRVEGEKIREIDVLFYNRGDRGEISRADYDALIKKSVAAISAATQTTFVPRGKNAANAVKADGVLWNTPKATYLLEYSFTKTPEIPFRSEFVRLIISPVEKPKSLLEESFAASKKAAPFRGLDHITTDATSGDVSIKDMPMVDQGQKGYCVVASAERVLRYYGIKVDENELAQLANSSASQGTSVRAMTESLKKLTARLKIRVRTLYEIDFRALIDDYAKAAKRAKDVGINSNVSEASQLYSQMKPDILRDARTKNPSALGGFKRHVKSHIDTGVPVLWSVVVGMVPNDGTKAEHPSGHMRLIIGYNDKTEEILFSDSWGPGHELKRMPAADAWAITNSMATIEPL